MGMRKFTRYSKEQRQQNIDKTEAMMLRGVTNTQQIANAFNLPYNAAHWMMKEVQRRWQEYSGETPKELVTKRIKQLEKLLTDAHSAYAESKKQLEVSEKRIKCSRCKGTGRVVEIDPSADVTEDELDEVEVDCWMCEGGFKIERTLKEKRSPGDVTYLRLAKEVIAELGKLEGLYPKVSVRQDKIIMESESIGDEKIRAQIETLYMEGEEDQLLNALAALDDIECASKLKAMEDQRDVIDAEFTKR